MGQRVVICDDDAHIRRAIQLKLKRGGFEIEMYPNGLEAWEGVQRTTPALVISDFQMPKMNGLELCQEIRGAGMTFPIVLLTAKGFELDENTLITQFGVTAVENKPFSPQRLLECVQELIAASEGAKQTATPTH